jgi:hypothetical protein
MANIAGGGTGSYKNPIPPAPSFTPRLSTPEPVGVPRWESPLDTSSYLQFDAGTYEDKPQATGLYKLGLGLAKAQDFLDAYKPIPEYQPGSVAQAGYTPSSTKTSGLGPNAYGWSGITGKGNRGASPFGFQTQMWQALSAANAAMKAAGLGAFGVTDGYRSYNQQVATKKKKGSLAATPGRSVHGLGLAADLRLTNKQLAWLKKNGSRYGLVNLPSESWHWQLNPTLWNGWR